MKLKNKEKESRGPKEDLIDLDNDVSKAVSRFNAVFEQLDSRLIDRSAEVEALKLCIIVRHHLMLDGLHGIAKSLLAEMAFSLIGGKPCIFMQQFMKNTQVEEIFGPLNVALFRQNPPVYEYYTEGMLPEAHFAFLDEVYRASDMCLPSMMRILNERKFFNGRKQVNCPLITAVGTTNFTTDTEELKAFHDRWLVHFKVRPLEKSTSRVRMLDLFLKDEEFKPDQKVSLDDIAQLTEGLNSVRVSDEMMDLFDTLVTSYRRNLSDRYVSDRRLCWSLRLAQARALLNLKDTLDAEDLVASGFGIHIQNDPTQTQALESAFQKVIGSYIQEKAEASQWDDTEKFVRNAEGKYDPSMPRASADKLYSGVAKVLTSLQNLSAHEKPKTQKQIDRHQDMVRRLESLANSLRFGKTTAS
jgi:MoxR-like ATPase